MSANEISGNELLARQVADWKREIMRLHDLIDFANCQATNTLSDEQIFDISEPFGAFEFGDAQGGKTLAFARAIISASQPVAPVHIGDSIRDYTSFREDVERLSAPGLSKSTAKEIRKSIYDVIDARVRNLAPVQAGIQPVGMDTCPISGRKFWGNIDHPELGVVATYGGPFDTFTIPALDDDDELRVERYDQDAGQWVEGGEPFGWFFYEQLARPADLAGLTRRSAYFNHILGIVCMRDNPNGPYVLLADVKEILSGKIEVKK